MKKYRITAFAAAALMLLSGCGNDPVKDPAVTGESVETVDPNTPPSEVVSLESAHYKITNDKLAYFFYKDYYDAVSAYYDSYYSAYGLDPTKDLKDQTYRDGTWFDHFMAVTVRNVMNYLYFAEAAADAGLTLDDADRESIDAEIEDIKSAAEEFGLSFREFLDSRFGEGLSEKALRECLELYRLSDKQYDAVYSSVNVTDADMEEYYSEHKESFLYVDYRMVEIRADQAEYADDDARIAGFAEGERQARYIEASANIDEYVERGVAYYKSINDSLEQPLTDDEIFVKVTNIVMQYEYNDKSAFGKWAFSGDRKSGDIVMLDNGAGIYTVYYLENAPYRKENATKNYRYLVFDSEEKAIEAFESFKSGEMTGEAFAALSEGREQELGNGALQENTDLGETVPAVEAWLFDPSRKPGDCEIREYNGSSFLVFFEGDGEISWKLSAKNAIVSEAVNKTFAEYQGKYEIKSNIDNAYLISGENAFTESGQN